MNNRPPFSLKKILLAFLVGILIATLFALWSNHRPFSKEQRLIIRQSDSVMYVTTWPEDSAVLRTPCADLTKAELKSKDLKTLMAKMLATVRAPQHDGVGIAAPQVGISKRLVCLQRFDKEGGPFECYPNIHIDSLFGAIGKGPEGCLSVPPMRGLVPRYTNVIVSYVDPETLEPKRDTVTGYTAVIFQHECDHLDGILYIDRADTVYVSPSWEAERRAYDYARPEWWPLLP
ncbi:MAG: peptide deformylase [Bacteroidales bacterium]|nr:peptide deformylase [Bacteroidales bacterium]